MLAEVPQRGGGFPGDIQKLPGNSPGQLVLADLVLIGVGKSWMKLSSEVPFNFRPSVILLIIATGLSDGNTRTV